MLLYSNIRALHKCRSTIQHRFGETEEQMSIFQNIYRYMMPVQQISQYKFWYDIGEIIASNNRSFRCLIIYTYTIHHANLFINNTTELIYSVIWPYLAIFASNEIVNESTQR